MFAMAESAWPRTGGDRGNRSNSNFPGPTEGRILHRVALANCCPDDTTPAVIVGSDGHLRVTCASSLFAIEANGNPIWELELEPPHSAPVALTEGRTLLTSIDDLCIVDQNGDMELTVRWDSCCDDSGPSPNISWANEPIVTSPMGPVSVLREWSWHELGVFGYDIPPPALYDDDSMAIAGYCGEGFCRVRADSSFVFRGRLREADLLPSVSRAQIAAVGSIKQGRSCFFDPEGAEIGTFAQPCLFAEYPGEQWIAAGGEGIYRLTREGRPLWERALPVAGDWGLRQPVVDSEGRIYAALLAGLVALDENGQRLFQLQLGTSRAGPPTIIAPGVLAIVVEDELLLIG
jgi:hypothetical protein